MKKSDLDLAKDRSRPWVSVQVLGWRFELHRPLKRATNVGELADGTYSEFFRALRN